MRVWMKRIFLLAVMACYLAFAYLLYYRWAMTERAVHSPVPFSALVAVPQTADEGGFHQIRHRVGWGAILAPLWVADGLTVTTHISLLIVHHTWRPLPVSLNAQIEHVSGALRAVLYAAFKVLLLQHLVESELVSTSASELISSHGDGATIGDNLMADDKGLKAPGPASDDAQPASDPTELALSWWLVFAPIYAAAALQMLLHSCKTLEGGETLFRGRESSRPRRRPGFALTLDDVLAFNISLHLNGVFYLQNANWSIVFWPLWLVAAICGVGLFLLLCFGVPMLSRRYPIRQFLMVFPPLLLLLATYTLALQALVNGVTWLDEPALGVTSADVMGPAIAAGWCLWMLLAIVTLSALWHVPGLPSSENDESSSEPPTYESLAAQMPKLLVRESSTLFRQVSARTLEAYDKRYGKLHENEEDVDKGIETDERRRGQGGAGIVAAGGAAERGRVSDRQSFDSFGNDIEARPAGSSSAATTTSAAAAASTSLSLPSSAGAVGGSCSSDPVASPRVSTRLATPRGGGDQTDRSFNANTAPCWVCFADTIVDEAVLLHCGHAGLCLECADDLWRRQLPCPLCRQKVVLVAQVGNVQTRDIDGKLVVLPQLPREPPPLTPPSGAGISSRSDASFQYDASPAALRPDSYRQASARTDAEDVEA